MAAVKPLVIRIAGELDSSMTSAVSQAQAAILKLANSKISASARVAAGAQLATKTGQTILRTAGAATAASFAYATKEAMQLNKEVANIGTLSVGAERQQVLKKGIQEVAITVGKETADIADGTYQVISAYGDAADTMQKVEINAKAARAGLATTSDAIALTTAVTKSYGDTSAAAVQKVSDLAFKTVELGQTTFPELASSMGKVSSMSTELGVSQEELFTSYATLTGVTGDAAAVQTQMMAIYNALLKPNKEMAATVKSLGYESGYSMIKTLGFAGTLNALKKATGGSSEELLKLYSNQRAMPAILALTGAQAENFTVKLGKLQNAAGATDKAFETQTQGISKTSFTLEQAKVKFQVAAQQFGDSIAPMVAKGADMVGDLADKISNMSDEQRRGAASAMLWTTGVGAGLVVAGKLTTGITQLYSFGTKLAKLKSLSTVGGTVSSVASAISPMLALTAAAAGAGKVMYDYLDKYWFGKDYHYADGMVTAAAEIDKASSKLREYTELQKELQTQELIIKNPSSSMQEIDAARSKIQEIAEMLGMSYDLNINADTTALDNVLSGNILTERADIIDKASDVITSSDKGKGKYEKNKAEVQDKQATVDEYSKYQKTLQNASVQMTGLNNELRSGVISDHDYTLAMQKIATQIAETGYYDATEAKRPTIDNAETAKNFGGYNTSGTPLNMQQAEIQSKIDWANQWLAKAKASTNDYEQSIQQSFNGLADVLAADKLFGKDFDVSTDVMMMKQLGTTMREAGMSTQEAAVQFATARSGYTDFSAAISDGKVGEMVQSFLDFNADIGETAENAAQGAALIANGFNDASQAVTAGAPAINAVVNDLARFGQAQGLDMTVDKLTEMANAIGVLPEGASITVDANGNFAVIDEAGKAIADLEDHGNVEVQVDANGDVTILNKATCDAQTLENMGAVDVAVNADGNIDILDEAGEKIATVNDDDASVTLTADDQATPAITATQEKADTFGVTNAQAIISVDDQASAKLDSIISKINDIPKSKTTTITTVYKTKGTPPGESARGQRSWRGGLTYVNDAQVADPREVIEHDGMRYWYSGRNVLANVPRGARIYTAQESRAMIDGSHRNGLDYVPYDGYVAELHRGERVLTEREAAMSDGVSGEISELLSMLRGLTNSGGGLTVTYSPVINVTGGADSSDVERALRDGYEQFTRFMERYERNERRTSFA